MDPKHLSKEHLDTILKQLQEQLAQQQAMVEQCKGAVQLCVQLLAGLTIPEGAPAGSLTPA